MKNRIRKLLLLTCAAVAALFITACGGSSDDSAASDDAAQTEDTADDASGDDAAADDSSDGDITGKYATIQEFIDSDMMQESLQEQMASLEGTGMSMSITGEDNKLIYSFTIDDPDLSQQSTLLTLNLPSIPRLLLLNPSQRCSPRQSRLTTRS